MGDHMQEHPGQSVRCPVCGYLVNKLGDVADDGQTYICCNQVHKHIFKVYVEA